MKLTAKCVMTSPAVSVRPETSLDEVFALLLRHHISGLPVVDKENDLVGVITEHDLLRLLFTPETPANVVSDLWTRKVISVCQSDPLYEVAELLLNKAIRRVPVVDEQNQLVGVISRRDVVRKIREIRQRIAMEMESRKKAGRAEEVLSASGA